MGFLGVSLQMINSINIHQLLPQTSPNMPLCSYLIITNWTAWCLYRSNYNQNQWIWKASKRNILTIQTKPISEMTLLGFCIIRCILFCLAFHRAHERREWCYVCYVSGGLTPHEEPKLSELCWAHMITIFLIFYGMIVSLKESGFHLFVYSQFSNLYCDYYKEI